MQSRMRKGEEGRFACTIASCTEERDSLSSVDLLIKRAKRLSACMLLLAFDSHLLLFDSSSLLACLLLDSQFLIDLLIRQQQQQQPQSWTLEEGSGREKETETARA